MPKIRTASHPPTLAARRRPRYPPSVRAPIPPPRPTGPAQGPDRELDAEALRHAARPGARWLSIVDDLGIARYLQAATLRQALKLTDGKRGHPLGRWTLTRPGRLFPALVCTYEGGAAGCRGRLELVFIREPWKATGLGRNADGTRTKADTSRPLL